MPSNLEEEYFDQHPTITTRSWIVEGLWRVGRRIRIEMKYSLLGLWDFFLSSLPAILAVVVFLFVCCLVCILSFPNKASIYGDRVDGAVYPANYLVCLDQSPAQFHCSSVSTGKEGLDLVLLGGGQKVAIHGSYVIFKMEKKTVSEWKRMAEEIESCRIVGTPPQNIEKP